MKHTILTCGKYQRLRHRLKHHMECTVLGVLESLYLYAGANGPIMAATDVEPICHWTCGEDGVLLAALTDTGDGAYNNFLDVLPDGKVQVHDYWDHAPDSVKTRERQRAYRESKRNDMSRDSNVTVTRLSRDSHDVSRYCNDEPNQTKPNQVCKEVTNVTSVAKGKRDIVLSPEEQEVVDYWDSKPEMTKTRGVTERRKKAIHAILKSPATKDLWKSSIDHVLLSDHHMGRKPGSTWKINFDWWCREEKVLQFAEMNRIRKTDKFGLSVEDVNPEEELGF